MQIYPKMFKICSRRHTVTLVTSFCFRTGAFELRTETNHIWNSDLNLMIRLSSMHTWTHIKFHWLMYAFGFVLIPTSRTSDMLSHSIFIQYWDSVSSVLEFGDAWCIAERTRHGIMKLERSLESSWKGQLNSETSDQGFLLLLLDLNSSTSRRIRQMTSLLQLLSFPSNYKMNATSLPPIS